MPKLEEKNDGPSIHDSETENVSINKSDDIGDESTEKAIAVYRKLREDASIDTKKLTENEIAQIDKECKIIEDRETIFKIRNMNQQKLSATKVWLLQVHQR